MENSCCLIATICVSSCAFFLHLTPFVVCWFHHRYMFFINLQKKSPNLSSIKPSKVMVNILLPNFFQTSLISMILLHLHMLLNRLLIQVLLCFNLLSWRWGDHVDNGLCLLLLYIFHFVVNPSSSSSSGWWLCVYVVSKPPSLSHT